jgi:hypothetical protein
LAVGLPLEYFRWSVFETVTDSTGTVSILYQSFTICFNLVDARSLELKIIMTHELTPVTPENSVRTATEDAQDMFHDTVPVCLFNSPDLDGHREPKNGSLTLQDPRYVSRYRASLTR